MCFIVLKCEDYIKSTLIRISDLKDTLNNRIVDHEVMTYENN